MRRGIDLASSSWQHGGWRHYRVRQRRWNDYAVGDSVCGYGPLSETVIINAVNNYKLRKMPQGSSWKNAVCYDPAQFAMSGVRDPTMRVGDLWWW